MGRELAVVKIILGNDQNTGVLFGEQIRGVSFLGGNRLGMDLPVEQLEIKGIQIQVILGDAGTDLRAAPLDML